MKITLEDEYTIVEIELKNPTGHISEVNQLARAGATALGFHFNSIKEHLPDQDELEDMFEQIATELGG